MDEGHPYRPTNIGYEERAKKLTLIALNELKSVPGNGYPQTKAAWARTRSRNN